MAINNDLFQWTLRRNLRLHNIEDAKMAKITAFFKDTVLPDMAEQLKIVNWSKITTRKARLALLRSIITTEVPFQPWKNSAMRWFSEIAQDEAQALSAWMTEQLPLQMEMIAPSPDLIKSVIFEKPFDGKIMGEWFNQLEQPWRDGIYRDFRSGFLQGKTIPEMAKMIRENNFGAFAVGGTRNAIQDSKAVVRTAATMVTNRAREATYAMNTDVVKGVRYVATLDVRTTLICANLHGNIYPIGEGERPPMHWACRSTTIPEVKSWEEMGLPASKVSDAQKARFNGQSEDMSNDFNVVMNGWSREDQNKFVGPVRGQLWRDGKVDNLEQFMQSTTKVKTLNQMGYTTAGNPLNN